LEKHGGSLTTKPPTEGPLRTLSAIVLGDPATTVWVGKNRVGKKVLAVVQRLSHWDKAIGKKIEIPIREHLRSEMTHNGFGLNMQIA
jgi:hypothetical protein